MGSFHFKRFCYISYFNLMGQETNPLSDFRENIFIHQTLLSLHPHSLALSNVPIPWSNDCMFVFVSPQQPCLMLKLKCEKAVFSIG